MAFMQNLRFPSRTLVGRQASACGLLRGVIAVLAITLVGNSIAYGQTAAAPNATKQNVEKLGVSKRVKVKELDGTKLRGTISAVNEDSFLLIPKDGGAAVAINYSQVATVKHDGLSRGTIIAIYVVVGLAIVIAVGAVIVGEELKNL
jgi:hypothetical protein